jgi:hypothetical protein
MVKIVIEGLWQGFGRPVDEGTSGAFEDVVDDMVAGSFRDEVDRGDRTDKRVMKDPSARGMQINAGALALVEETIVENGVDP